MTDSKYLVRFDLDRLALLQELGGEAFLRKLFHRYVTEGENAVGLIECAVANHESVKLLGLAHTLKGASLNLGLLGVAEIAKSLEACGREETLGLARTLLPQLSEAFNEARHELEARNARTNAEPRIDELHNKNGPA